MNESPGVLKPKYLQSDDTFFALELDTSGQATRACAIQNISRTPRDKNAIRCCFSRSKFQFNTFCRPCRITRRSRDFDHCGFGFLSESRKGTDKKNLIYIQSLLPNNE